MSQHKSTPHPYAEQLARNPNYIWGRCAPHLHRVQQDQKFKRKCYDDSEARELAERLAVVECELRRLREQEKQDTPAPTPQVQQPETPKPKPCRRRYGDHRR